VTSLLESSHPAPHDREAPVIIPDFVLPDVRALTRDCWVFDADTRPTFGQIVERLKEMRFKLTGNVNMRKVEGFVSTIESWELDQSESG
jgi:hypothetical protein